MADLYTWQALCIALMVAIIITNHLLERSTR